MASNKYYYQVLGVQSNASQDEIKQAFHQLAHKYHPDISTEPNAEQKFQDINEAYTALKHQKPINKKRSKLPIIAAAIVGIISLVAIIIFFYQNSLNAEEIQAGILNRNSEAIQSLENANINLAQKVISGTAVKVALIDFYLKNPPLWNKLDSYHHSIRAEILKDDQVYHRLRDHYYHQIDNEVKEDKFKKALPLLGELKKAYPKKSELFQKYQQIQDKKQQRLADLTQKYMDCLYKTWVPLLERTHCMAAARDTIETVGIEHELPTDANLPAMYAKEVRLALKDQNYDHADDILLDWEKLLPANSEQRDVLKDILYLRRERENIIADLSGNDKMQIAKRLHQLSADPVLQEQVLEIAKVKNNLSKYKFNELLTIIASNYGDISPDNESKLREILEIPEEDDEDDTTTQIANASTTIPPTIPIAIPIQANTQEEVVKNNTTKINNLLVECKQLYNKNYLTRGKRTALSCYRDILKIEPNNNQALDGINNIENKYYVWADSALRKKKFGRVNYYIQALQKFNSNSSRLTGLKEKLKTAQRQAVAQANETTKAKEAARLARIKASREKEVKEREARLKAAREAKRAARLKAAKEKAAAERIAKRKAARKKAAQERAAIRKALKEKTAKRKAARAKAAQERVAKRKAARAKAAQERAAKRKAARAKAAQERAAKRKAARAKAAQERAAKRKAARAKAAQERAAKRKAARAKAAQERAAKRKAARAKAAQERAAKRKAARAKAAKERAAKRKAARAKAAQERAAKRKAARAKAAKERAAKRKAARAKAAQERAAKRKAARAKAAKERAAKRKAARAKAIKAARMKAVRDAARRKLAREKAAQERAAKRKAARAKAAKERAAKRKAARAKAAKERAAKRKAARAKAAQAARMKAAREAAKRKLARKKAAKRKAAAKKRAARLRAAKAKQRKAKQRRKRGGSCSKLVRQMSTGIKPLTPGQRAYFRRNCR